MNRRNSRETGSVLVFSLVVTALAFAFAGGLTVMSITNARAVTERNDQRIAFYLAEAGLETAKREVSALEDLGGDGVGNASAEFTIGDFAVVATDLGGGNYQLTSTGTAPSNVGVTLQEVVVLEYGSQFPDGAVSIVGTFDKEKIKFKKHAGLVIDGGDSSAFAFSSEDFYEEFSDELVEAIEKDELEEVNLTGEDTSTFEGKDGDLDLPVTQEIVEQDTLDNLMEFYDQLRAGIDSTLPKAELAGEILGKGTDVYNFGTKDEPVTLLFDKKVELKHDDVITGYGTLIVGEHFKVKDDSHFQWEGDVIVIADEKKKGKVEIDGFFNVKGNVVVIGEGEEHVEFKVKDDSRAEINGSLYVGTNYNPDKAKKAKFEVDGQLTVNGVTTLLGSKVELKVKDDADLVINGMLQIGLSEHEKKSEIKMEFDGNMEIHRDTDMIQRSAEELERLGVEIGAAGIVAEIYEYSFQSQYWGQVYAKPDPREIPGGVVK